MAVAFGAVSSGADGAGASSRSVTLSSSGTDVVGYVGVYGELTGSAGTDALTGVTWGGNAMSFVNKKIRSNNLGWQYVYALASPPSGSQTITATFSGNAYIALMAIYYTGGKQTGIPDAGNTAAAGPSNSLSTTFTTIADNCWTAAFGISDNGGVGVGTNMTSRATYNGSFIWGDRNSALTPAGSTTIGIVGTGNGNQIVNGFSIAPAVAAGPTNLKSLDGNLKANIKSISGNLIANVKSFDGNS